MRHKLVGTPAAPGLCMGHAVVVTNLDCQNHGRSIASDEIEAELERFEAATRAADLSLQEIQQSVSQKLGQAEAEIIEAQRLMLQDPSFTELVRTKIGDKLISAEQACKEAVEEQAQILERLDDEYLAARALDMRDVGNRLLLQLTGVQGLQENLKQAAEGSVIVADDLAPSQTAGLDADKVVGILLDRGGKTSHTAILSRSMGIPAVVGLGSATGVIKTGDLLLVDGESGTVIVEPDTREVSIFTERLSADTERKQKLDRLRALPSVTTDGRPIEVAANIEGPKDIERVKQAGAEGVGLFRTEFLYVDRSSPPSEDEQYESYRQVLGSLSPLPVVIRTLDAGGDKALPYLGLSAEDNPFLGLRAIRLCLKEKAVFRTQLRALLRASHHGNLRIMFPMISTLLELTEAKKEYECVRAELEAEGVPISPHIQIGIMIEVPSAALQADVLAEECDFFSIGTNDLVQYTMASDRGNSAVSYLNSPFEPAVLRLIDRTIREGHRKNIWVGMCGEMAGMPEAIPLLAGMNIDKLSMAPPLIPAAKEIMRSLDHKKAATIWETVKNMTSSEDIRSYLRRIVQG